jgi:hypothetical protein
MKYFKIFLVCTFGILFLAGGSVHAQQYWQKLSAFPSMYVHALAIDGSGRIFAGSFGNGVYRSTDDGTTWIQLISGLTNRKVHSICVHPSGYVFVGTDSGGVFRSADNGANWSNVGLPGKIVLSLAVKSSGEIFAGVGFPGVDSGGVFRSTNNGASWEPASSGLTSSAVNALAINSDGYIFAGTGGDGVFKSTDNGSSWINMGLGGVSVTAIAIKADTIMLSGSYLEGIYNSTDKGESWYNYGQTFSTCRSLAFNSDGIFFAGTDHEGIFRSESNGECWYQMGLDIDYIRAIIFNSSGYMFAGTDAGIYRSVNSTNQILSVDICSLNLLSTYPPNFSVVDSVEVKNSSQNPVSISSITINDTNFSVFPESLTINGSASAWVKITFAARSLGTYRATMSLITTPTAFPELVSLHGIYRLRTISVPPVVSFRPVYLGEYTDTTFSITNTGADPVIITNIVSTNPAFSFISRKDTIAAGARVHDTIRFTPINGELNYGYIIIYSNALSSPDIIWINGTGLRKIGVSPKSIAYDSVNLGGFKDSTFTITNTGKDTLKDKLIIAGIFSTNPAFSIVSTHHDTLIMGQRGRDTIRVRFTPNVDGLDSGYIIIQSNVLGSPDSIKVTGFGKGSTDVADKSMRPFRFTLGQNFPNPFNPSTTIEFSIPQSGYVSLKVLNILGQEVATLVSEYQSAGRYSHVWNADGFPSGTYFYRLQTGTSIEIKKLTLIK